MQKYFSFLLVVSMFSVTIIASILPSTAKAHKTGNEVRHANSCKSLDSKRKYKKCMKCLKGKGKGDKHFHADRLFQRCMLNGKLPFFRSGPAS